MKERRIFFNRGIVFVLTFILTVQSSVCVFARESDTGLDSDTCSDWAVEEVSEAISQGLVPEELQSDYQKPVTRRELAKLSSYYLLWHEPKGTSVETMWQKRDEENDIKREQYDNGESDYYRYYQENVFTDTNDECVNRLYQFHFISGFPDGTFRPDDFVTRAQAAVMLWHVRKAYYVYALNVTFTEEWATKARFRFTDIPEQTMWYESEMSRMYTYRIMTGISETYYGVDLNMTREQAIVTMLRMTKSEI